MHARYALHAAKPKGFDLTRRPVPKAVRRILIFRADTLSIEIFRKGGSIWLGLGAVGVDLEGTLLFLEWGGEGGEAPPTGGVHLSTIHCP